MIICFDTCMTEKQYSLMWLLHSFFLDVSSYPSFAGCLRNFTIDGTIIDLTNTSDRIVTSGCPATVSPHDIQSAVNY